MFNLHLRNRINIKQCLHENEKNKTKTTTVNRKHAFDDKIVYELLLQLYCLKLYKNMGQYDDFNCNYK